MFIKSAAAGAIIFAAAVAWGQSAAPLAFEVASVKQAAPSAAPGQRRAISIGADRVDFPNVTLWYCITYAYGMKSYQVFGPSWLRDARYEVAAKGPAGATREQLPGMMQTLLAERFKLHVHHETRELSGLVLLVGKNGRKLKEAAATSGDGAGGASIGMSASPTGERLDIKGASMATLATTLTGLLGRPVVDKTGLTGRYDFALEFSRSETAGPGATGGYNEPPPLPPPPPGAEPGLSIYSVIQDLGLRLDLQKLPLDVIVIDHAEKIPIEN